MGYFLRFLLTASILLYLPVTFAEAGQGRSSNRLKFKDGPVCMCTGGLSEKDIQAAQNGQFELFQQDPDIRIKKLEVFPSKIPSKNKEEQ